MPILHGLLLNDIKANAISPLVKALIGIGAIDVNQHDEDGNTPLMLAVKQKDSVIAKFLLANGADVNKTSTDGIHVLMAAVERLDKPMIELLLLHKANPNIVQKGL